MYTYDISDFPSEINTQVLFKEVQEQLPLHIIRRNKVEVRFYFHENINQTILDNIVSNHNSVSSIYDPNHIISIPLMQRRIKWTSWATIAIFNHEGTTRIGEGFSIRGTITPKNNNSSCSIRLINKTSNQNMGEISDQNEGLVEIIANNVPTTPFILEIQAKVESRSRWSNIDNLNFYINGE